MAPVVITVCSLVLLYYGAFHWDDDPVWYRLSARGLAVGGFGLFAWNILTVAYGLR